MVDWYEHRHELWPGMVFELTDGTKVKLERRVPGDGTKWYVADDGGKLGWLYSDSTIEPGELVKLIKENT